MRADAPAGSATAGGSDDQGTGPEPGRRPADAEPRDTDASAPQPEPTGEIHAQTQTDQVNEELQEENAETSLDQPSDGSGGE